MKLSPQRIETIIGFLIALHSLILGLAMAFQPIRTLELFGWNYQGPMFFPTQTSVLLILFGILFMAIIFHRSLTWFIIVVKTVTVLLDGLMDASVTSILIWQKVSEN